MPEPEHGLRGAPPPLGDYAFNLAEIADYMFDHAIFNDCMANVDFCEQMVKETNPTLLQKAESTSAPHMDIHGYKTIADIMRSLNPFTGDFYLETLHVARYTREMYCLFGGRHTHPSTIMPGGCSADITHQTMTDYYVRLMRYFDYVKRSVPMHDDLYDFFLESLPGYDMVGYRDTNLVCWGAFDDPEGTSTTSYEHMTEWGSKRYVTPGIAINGELMTTDLVEINLMIRILLGSSYFDDWDERADVRHPGSAGQPGGQAPPVEQGHAAQAAEARLHRQVHLGRVAAHLRQAHGHPRVLRHRRRAVRPPVVHGQGRLARHRVRQGDGRQPQDGAAQGRSMPEMELEWKVPEKSNAIERDRARTYHQAYSALMALHNLEKALVEVRAGRTKSWTDFKVPRRR